MTPSTHLFPAISYADCIAEAKRELAARRAAYPDRVKQGRMTAAEAEYQIAVLAAIADDARRMLAAQYIPATHGYSWLERRKALNHELDKRRRFYPDWIKSGRMTEAAGTHQNAALSALLYRYDSGFDWRPSNGTPQISATQIGKGPPATTAQRETAAEIRSIWRYPDGHFYRLWHGDDPQVMPQQAAML